MPAGVWVITIPAGVAVAMLLFLFLRAKLSFLKIIASPVETSALRRASDAEQELERANNAIELLTKERDDLRKERSLETVITLVEDVSGGVTTMLDKLGDLNGSLTHTREGLHEAVAAIQAATKAIEFLAGQMVSHFP